MCKFWIRCSQKKAQGGPIGFFLILISSKKSDIIYILNFNIDKLIEFDARLEKRKSSEGANQYKT